MHAITESQVNWKTGTDKWKMGDLVSEKCFRQGNVREKTWNFKLTSGGNPV